MHDRNTMMRWIWLIVFCFVLPTIVRGNLIANPGLEGAPGNALPPHWSKTLFGSGPIFTTDNQVAHEGKTSVRIAAKEMSRAYIESEPIEVAGAEKISASAWVKCKDVLVKPGHVILLGDFSQEDGRGRRLEKFDSATKLDNQWEKMSGDIWVPPNVTRMRLMIGFAYSHGTIWIDDVSVITPLPLVVQVPPLHGRLSPGLEEMPVVVMNRTGERGTVTVESILSPAPPEPTKKTAAKPVTRPTTGLAASQPITRHKRTTQSADDDDDEEDPSKKAVPSTQAIVRAKAATTKPSAERHFLEFVLNGKTVQKVSVPVAAEHRGDRELYLVMYRGKEPIFATVQPVHVPEALVLEPPSPTHWVVEDGAPHFTGLVDLAVRNSLRNGGKIRIDVVDGKGKIWGSWNSNGDLADGANSYSINAASAPIDQYKIIAHFFPHNRKTITTEQHWRIIPRKLASVTINAAGYPVYDGHAIFPLGVFNGSDWKSLQAGGFTISHAYNAADVVEGEAPDDLAAQKFLDDSEKYGFKAIFLIPRGFVFAHDWTAFRRRVRMFKNHPALLAWDEEEGIARGDMSLADLRTMVQIIREEDPYHPIMIGDSRDTIARMGDRSNFFPANQMDMGMWWWYPFPLKNLSAGALQGDEGASNSELVLPAFFLKRNTDKPVWIGVQSYRQRKSTDYPTIQEYRAQAYAAICAGAKGLMYYGGGVTRGIGEDPEAAHWKALQGIVKEISKRADFWMEAAAEHPAFEPANIPFSAIIKRHGGRTIIVAVNRSMKPAEVSLHLSGLNGTASVVDEKRNVNISNGILREQFGPLGVHVYEFGR